MNRRNFLSNTLLSASAAALPFSVNAENTPSVLDVNPRGSFDGYSRKTR
jgi:hypothetical protein